MLYDDLCIDVQRDVISIARSMSVLRCLISTPSKINRRFIEVDLVADKCLPECPDDISMHPNLSISVECCLL
jgi:hypothetical protein